MMQIKFSPQRRDTVLVLERQGDALIVNGDTFDFSPLPEGGILPESAIDSMWFLGPVTRHDGVLHVKLLLPVSATATRAALFPEPLLLTTDGPVELPQ